ncbi:hypothetical protein [Cognatiyoonia sp. IB215182]|uniref:glycosyltransferase family protein n=1 Tax=Cognatiyoonia sp. IB215182 TaxID=3097353 RepID=UPI002A103F00|nr:hypothetical protein [Cognatiyoonia sp. IB215182]MDX8355649.1 hypothetical protein [Cognatiyoonia sp. IB215182]
MLRSAVEGFDPDLMIIDNVPRGAQYELDKTLAMLSRHGRCRVVLGLRDVIDERTVTRRQWLRQRNFETIRRHFDEVWIYGDPNVYDILTDCGMSEPIGARCKYVGYLDPTGRRDATQAAADLAQVRGADKRPYVFCAVGGGRDGLALCEAFAAASLPSGHRGILVTGTQMPDNQKARIAAMAQGRDNLTVLSFLREPIQVMHHAARIIGMGGYNTTVEMLALRRPALIVPRCAPRREQIMRTERLAARELVSMLHPGELSPSALGHWMANAITKPGPGPDMNGLARVQALARSGAALIPAAA